MPSHKNGKKKTYRSHHTNYGSFIRYIENHVGIDETVVQRAKAKLGTIKSNNVDSNKGRSNNNNRNNSNNRNNNKNKNNNNKMGVTENYINQNNKEVFTNQMSEALTKAEQDDARHADLHANVKTKDMTDSDKIFLLKREVDNLKDQLGNGSDYNGAAAAASKKSQNGFFVTTNLPLLSAFLLFGIVLLSARFLSRKLRLARASGSLLLDGETGSDNHEASRNYEYHQTNHNQGIVGFELQDQSKPSSTTSTSESQQQQQGGLFSKLASVVNNNNNNTTNMAAYEAPSEQASIQFV